MTLSLLRWHERYQQQAKWTANLRKHLYSRAGMDRAQKVLDVGCGTGVLLDELTDSDSSSVFGIDIDRHSVSMAQTSIPNAGIVIGDGISLPYRSGSFDITLCHFVLLWVKNPLQFIQEMTRVTRPGGYILVLAEPDYGGRIDYPDELATVGKWQTESLLRQGANPFLGRELRSFFSASNLINVEVGVLGGQWMDHDDSTDHETEWEVIDSDLQGKVEYLQIREELKTLDKSSRKTNQRILFVPVFYAIGELKL